MKEQEQEKYNEQKKCQRKQEREIESNRIFPTAKNSNNCLTTNLDNQSLENQNFEELKIPNSQTKLSNDNLFLKKEPLMNLYLKQKGAKHPKLNVSIAKIAIKIPQN